MRLTSFPAWAASLCVTTAFAQTIARKEPVHYAGQERASRVEARPPGIRLGLRRPPEFALPPLSAPEAARLAAPDTRLRTGVHRQVPSDALAAGTWEITSEGKRVWRMALRSADSAGVRIEFSNFAIGAGKLWLHDGAESVGPYTGRGPYDSGQFWSASLFSESVILEYEPEGQDASASAVPFEIHSISHQAPKSLQDTYASTKDSADTCHLDPNCYAEWKPAM